PQPLHQTAAVVDDMFTNWKHGRAACSSGYPTPPPHAWLIDFFSLLLLLLLLLLLSLSLSLSLCVHVCAVCVRVNMCVCVCVCVVVWLCFGCVVFFFCSFSVCV